VCRWNCRPADVSSAEVIKFEPENFFLANDYNSVMIVAKKLRTAAVSAVAEVEGRSRVEPAAVTFFQL
jgi:hypothetical protein